MRTLRWQLAWAGIACIFYMNFLALPLFGSENHVVSPAEMQKAAVAATQSREQNVEAVTQFLSSPRAKQALQMAHLNPTQVKTAVSTLSDEEVGQLAARVNKAQADFAAGTISTHDMTLIILGLVALILIIVAVR